MKLFFSYAREDEALREKLITHLALLRNQGIITTWHDRDITAGDDWAQAINTHLNTADIILLLISADFMASRYCYEIEMQRAIERHTQGEARVIPIILRSCDWESAPFGNFQAMPLAQGIGIKPVTRWEDEDEVFAAIAREIRQIAEQRTAKPAPSQTIGWIEEVRSRCCKKILNQHSTIQLLNQKEIGVDQLYVDVWLLDRSPHTFQVSESKLLELFDLRNDRLGLGDRIKRNEGIKVANDEANLMILGKPGAGKTTFLKHLAVECCNGQFQPNLIPVLIELRRIQSTKWEFLDALSKELKLEKQQTQKLLEEGNLLILMDGLDEIPTHELRRSIQEQVTISSQRFGIQRQQLRSSFRKLDKVRTETYQLTEDYQRKLNEIFEIEIYLLLREAQIAQSNKQSNKFTLQELEKLIDETYTLCLKPYCRFVLTCRTQIIEVIPQGFASVEVADFNEKQVEKFVENWLRASQEPESSIIQKLQTFAAVLQNNAALKELTATPVLLSLMCLVLQDAGELPSQAVLLYRRGIRLLLEQWNDLKEIPGWKIGTQVYQKLDPEQKEALLTKIAAQKFENPSSFVLFQQTELGSQIAEFLKLASVRQGEAVLKAIEAQHGLLVERADELWSFSHLTFQEYFTAQWLIQLQENAGLAEKIVDKRWQEVVKLAIKSQQPADRLLRLVKQAIDQSVSQEKKLQFLLAWVHEKTQAIEAPYKPAAIRAFCFACTFASDRNLSRQIDPDLALAIDRDFAREFTHALALTVDPAPAHLSLFTEIQRLALQRYYDANNFLVELLKEPGAVSDRTRQEIEDNLLLPIAELKRRLPDQYE